MNVKQRIVSMMHDVEGIPSKLYLTRHDEIQLMELGSRDLPEGLLTEFVTVGPRRALLNHGGAFLGLQVFWDADHMSVE